ncbi:hypothetical protein BAOM_2192 [Peribacillus asahii]|uniref:Uncharacterized protein n=1 Tax=Peribacillus asahii TaxID=228899 RepID=A0A3Q9RMX7_9BACI|nr:hypothetical protein BAOM_2192 [Peribacillus asahii]
MVISLIHIPLSLQKIDWILFLVPFHLPLFVMMADWSLI